MAIDNKCRICGEWAGIGHPLCEVCEMKYGEVVISQMERELWMDSPLYNLMCDVVNGDRSDWPTGYGEPSHRDYMLGTRQSEER